VYVSLLFVQTVGLDCSEAVEASAKSGIGIQEILEQIVQKVPPPVRAGATA
jgi:GTP-binding protein LepA